MLRQLESEIDNQEKLFNLLKKGVNGFDFDLFQADTIYYEAIEITNDQIK